MSVRAGHKNPPIDPRESSIHSKIIGAHFHSGRALVKIASVDTSRVSSLRVRTACKITLLHVLQFCK